MPEFLFVVFLAVALFVCAAICCYMAFGREQRDCDADDDGWAIGFLLSLGFAIGTLSAAAQWNAPQSNQASYAAESTK